MSEQIRWFVATGLQGYGPDGSDNNFNPCETWTQVADAIKQEIDEANDYNWDGYLSEGESGQYEEAWKTHLLIRELDNIAGNFSNERAKAPLYRNAQGEPDSDKWDAEVQRLIGEHIPLDITHNTRLYAWPCDDAETWADHTKED